MSTVRKFTFDLDFDAPEEPEVAKVEEEEEEPEEEIPTFSEEELEQARAEGFGAGKEEGRREAADATEQKLLEAIEKACSELAEIYNTQTEANREIGREMVSVSTSIAKKMFPDLNARNALGEVERVVQETLKAVTEEPRIQIMVNPELREPLGERLATMTHRAGFEGKVFVNPDPSMTLGDCRIEWSNGAAVRDGEELWEMIEKIIEHNLHGPAETEDETGEDASAPTDASTQTADAAHDAAEQSERPSEDADTPTQDSPDETEDGMDADIGNDFSNEAEDDFDAENESPEEVSADETPSWQAATSESPDVAAASNAESVPEPIAQPAEIASDDGDDIAPSAIEGSAHGPTFAPNLDDAEDFTAEEYTQSDQEVTDTDEAAPIPHIDDEGDAGESDSSDAADDGAPTPSIVDPDPVSPATQAAILDAQSAMDDDDRDPSGG